MSPFIAELIGTMLLILMGGGVVANVVLTKTKGHGAGWLAICTAWALAVFIGVVVARPYSGAHLNPAISVGLALGGLFPWGDVLPYIVAQMIGAAAGATLVWLVYKDHFDATEDEGAKLGVFSINAEIRHPVINFLTEAAFYDILQSLCIKYDFTYPDDKTIELAKHVKKLVDSQAQYPDWDKREDIKSALKVGLVLLLDEHGYPPVERDEVYTEIFEQAENFKKNN